MGLTAVIVIGLLIFGVAAAASERTWTRSEILAIADKEAKWLGYNVERDSVSFHKDSEEFWNWLKSMEVLEEEGYDFSKTGGGSWKEVRAALSNRKFWAVHYDDLGMPTHGGSLWVLIDRDTGEPINTIPYWNIKKCCENPRDANFKCGDWALSLCQQP